MDASGVTIDESVGFLLFSGKSVNKKVDWQTRRTKRWCARRNRHSGVPEALGPMLSSGCRCGPPENSSREGISGEAGTSCTPGKRPRQARLQCVGNAKRFGSSDACSANRPKTANEVDCESKVCLSLRTVIVCASSASTSPLKAGHPQLDWECLPSRGVTDTHTS